VYGRPVFSAISVNEARPPSNSTVTEQASALIELDQLVSSLKHLAGHHKSAGRISHALGVQSALDLIKRERKAIQAHELAAVAGG
jgi:hypothetical protein